MNKVFYIIAMVLSVVFAVVIVYYVEEVSSARFEYIMSSTYSSYDTYGTYTPSYTSSSSYEEITQQAGLISLLFFLFFIATDILGLLKVKTKTTKVLSIIGVSFGGLFLIWDIMMIASPGAMTFDEVGGGFFLYVFIALAFSIVGLIQSIRFANGKTKTVGGNDLLDS